LTTLGLALRAQVLIHDEDQNSTRASLSGCGAAPGKAPPHVGLKAGRTHGLQVEAAAGAVGEPASAAGQIRAADVVRSLDDLQEQRLPLSPVFEELDLQLADSQGNTPSWTKEARDHGAPPA
jgi:hypothetical protein